VTGSWVTAVPAIGVSGTIACWFSARPIVSRASSKLNESSTSNASVPLPAWPPGTFGTSMPTPSVAFSPADDRLSVPSNVPASLPVFSNVAAIATVPPRPSVISAVAAPNVTLKPANQIDWSTWTVLVVADGSGATDSAATEAGASDATISSAAAGLVPPQAATEMASAPAIASAGMRRPGSPAEVRIRIARTSFEGRASGGVQ
jgi:hypothetical protein